MCVFPKVQRPASTALQFPFVSCFSTRFIRFLLCCMFICYSVCFQCVSFTICILFCNLYRTLSANLDILADKNAEKKINIVKEEIKLYTRSHYNSSSLQANIVMHYFVNILNIILFSTLLIHCQQVLH